MAESIFQVWNQQSDNIPGSSLKIADQIALSNFQSATYLLSFNYLSKNKSLTIKINKSEAGIFSQVWGKSGDPLNILIDAFSNGGNMELRITNNESFNINYTLARAKV